MRRRLSGRVAAAAEEGSLQLRQGDASDEWVWGVALRVGCSDMEELVVEENNCSMVPRFVMDRGGCGEGG